MVQHFEEKLPEVSRTIATTVDAQTGELLYSGPAKNVVLEGSYTSKINVFCDGYKVVVQGNASRWNRVDNLFGYQTIEDCVAVYNQILSGLGLPHFSPAEGWFYRQTKEGEAPKKFSKGAKITQIDFTRNWSVGKGREFSFIRGASSMKLGRRVGRLFENGATVSWGGGSWKYDKLYIKSFDLIKHQKKRTLHLSPQEKAYYQSLIDYCNNFGCIREEQSLKQKYLERNNLSSYGLVREEDFKPHLNEIEDMFRRLEVNHMNYETIAEQLIEKGVCASAHSANSTEAVALKWLHGAPIDKTKRQYYEHRKRLLQIGIDIAIPHDVTRLPPQIRSSEKIELKELPVPPWYRLPQVKPQLRLVS